MTSRRRMRVRPRDLVIVGVLLLGLVAGVVLVVTGGSSEDDPTDAGRPAATVPFERVSVAEIEEWSGLDVPAGAEGFLTARVGDAQLDVTFTMASGDEAAFVSESGLPELVAGDRQVLHSSPLWKLNPGAEGDDGTTTTGSTPTTATTLAEERDPDTEVVPDTSVRAAADTHEGIRRAVELVDEGADTVRARIVLSGG